MTTSREALHYLTLGDITELLLNAGHLGTSADPHNTVRTWRKRGKLPAPDATSGSKRPSPLWDPSTVSDWIGTLGQ